MIKFYEHLEMKTMHLTNPHQLLRTKKNLVWMLTLKNSTLQYIPTNANGDAMFVLKVKRAQHGLVFQL